MTNFSVIENKISSVKKYLDILEKISIDKLFRKLATKKRYRHQELSTFSFTNQPYSDNSLSYL